MYHDFLGREIEDLEGDNMRRDAAEERKQRAISQKKRQQGLLAATSLLVLLVVGEMALIAQSRDIEAITNILDIVLVGGWLVLFSLSTREKKVSLPDDFDPFLDCDL